MGSNMLEHIKLTKERTLMDSLLMQAKAGHLVPLSLNLRATGRTRTADPRITNALLYQLSHSGNFH